MGLKRVFDFPEVYFKSVPMGYTDSTVILVPQTHRPPRALPSVPHPLPTLIERPGTYQEPDYKRGHGAQLALWLQAGK